MEKLVTFRVDDKLKQSFEQVAKAMDRTSSQLLRDYMKNIVNVYIQESKKNGR